MKSVRVATMSVYLDGQHRTNVPPDPEYAAIEEGFILFEAMLAELQKNGVAPGTRLRITVSPVPARKKCNAKP